MSILIMGILVNLFRGGKGSESIIGLESCGAGDWVIQFVYLMGCIAITHFAIKYI